VDIEIDVLMSATKVAVAFAGPLLVFLSHCCFVKHFFPFDLFGSFRRFHRSFARHAFPRSALR